MSSAAIDIDIREVDAILSRLDKTTCENIIFEGLRQESNSLKLTTQRVLLNRVPAASSTRLTGRPMYEGVQNKHRKKWLDSIVHVFGDHRLRWLEGGTADRYTGKRNVYDKITGEFTGQRRIIRKRRSERKNVIRYTGRMKARHFFADARRQTDAVDIMTKAIIKEIEKVTGEKLQSR